jgi:dTMP kinase
VSDRYVVFEGVDGAGKTTVARAVADALVNDGEDVLWVREPGGTEVGEAIRHVLLTAAVDMADWPEAMLFAAARSQLAAEVVGPALEAGRTVISDRSVYSSLAYQGGGRDLGISQVRRVNEAGLGGVWPHVVVLLRVDAATALDREDVTDRISVEGVALQERVAAAYDRLAEDDPERFEVIDASQPFQAVVDAALAALRRRW